METNSVRKRLQVIFSDEAWAAVEAATSDANRDFEVGSISYSDVINEMILTSKLDLRMLQAKHTDIKRSLRVLASQDSLDLDTAIRTLMDLKSKVGRRGVKSPSTQEEA